MFKKFLLYNLGKTPSSRQQFCFDLYLPPSAVSMELKCGRISPVARALDCIAEARGFDFRGRTNTQGLKIAEK